MDRITLLFSSFQITARSFTSRTCLPFFCLIWVSCSSVCSRFVSILLFVFLKRSTRSLLTDLVSNRQESLAASFGAGLSTACVIDVGATKTTVACVEDGMVLPETRCVFCHSYQHFEISPSHLTLPFSSSASHSLSYGGDDLTTFFYILLQRSHFPYKTLGLNRSLDFSLIESLKENLCTLSEVCRLLSFSTCAFSLLPS